jgi:SAM-dependent methyltransferase
MSRTCLETTPGRLSLESFLSSHATRQLTLEVGAEDPRCRKWFPNLVAINVSSNSNINTQADAYRLPFRDDIFELAVCTEVLEHTHSPELVLRELQRVLKPGGKLLLTTPFAFPIHYAPTDYYRFTRFGLAHLLHDWEIESLSEATSDGAALATYFHHWLLKKKGIQWKPPKLVWWGVWNLLTRSYRKGLKLREANGHSNMPAGYLVVAFKPAKQKATHASTNDNRREATN